MDKSYHGVQMDATGENQNFKIDKILHIEISGYVEFS